MSEAKKILEMIESVDPNDTAALDKIDFAVLQYRLFNEYQPSAIGYTHTKDGSKPLVAEKYTRSRDALKAIRPSGEEWHFIINKLYSAKRYLESSGLKEGWRAKLTKARYEDSGRLNVIFATNDDGVFATEELAELHAIISAIDYERLK